MAGCTVKRAAKGCPGLKARRREGERPSQDQVRTERVRPDAILRRDVYALHGCRCLCCGETEKIELDHVIPVSLGGSNDVDNLQPLCRSCNSKKADRYIDFRGDQAAGPEVLRTARDRRRDPVRRIGG